MAATSKHARVSARFTPTSDTGSITFSATATTGGQDSVTVDLTDDYNCTVSASLPVAVTGYPPSVVNNTTP